MQKEVNKYLKWLFLTPLFLLMGLVALAFLYFVYCEVNKAYWDRKVDELCAKDGGVTIYEKSVIYKHDYPKIKILSNGSLFLPTEKNYSNDDPYFIRFKFDSIHEGYSSVGKSTTYIIRNSDDKVMSSMVTYGRSGGDILPEGIFYPSHYSCSNKNENLRKFQSTVIVNGE